MRTWFVVTALYILSWASAYAITWTAQDLSNKLPTGRVNRLIDINDRGDILIHDNGPQFRNGTPERPFTTDFLLSGGTPKSLRLLPGATDAIAAGMSSWGNIVGYNIFPDGTRVPVVWGPHTISAIPIPSDAILKDVSDWGTVVGEYMGKPFKWFNPVAGMVFFQTNGYPATVANLLSNGYVAGTLLSPQHKAVLWTPQGNMQVLGDCEEVVDCNDKLQVLANTAYGVWIYQPGQDTIYPPSWEWSNRYNYEGTAIGNNGYIVGGLRDYGMYVPWWRNAPLIWHPSMTDWMRLPLPLNTVSIDASIKMNNQNVIIGGLTDTQGIHHPIVWRRRPVRPGPPVLLPEPIGGINALN